MTDETTTKALRDELDKRIEAAKGTK